jgi:hypothetical protein
MVHKRNNLPHLSEDELQDLLEARLAGEETLPAHLGDCRTCRARLERYESLFALLDTAEPAPAPAGLERAVMSRLFPSPQRSFALFRSPLPRWIPAAALVVLTLSTAFSFSLFRLFGVALAPVVEVVLQRRLDYFVTPFRLAAGALDKISALGTWVGQIWGDSQVTVSALLHLWEAPEVRLLILASAGIYTMIVLGWGSRLLLGRSRGGIHNAMLA